MPLLSHAKNQLNPFLLPVPSIEPNPPATHTYLRTGFDNRLCSTTEFPVWNGTGWVEARDNQIRFRGLDVLLDPGTRVVNAFSGVDEQAPSTPTANHCSTRSASDSGRCERCRMTSLARSSKSASRSRKRCSTNARIAAPRPRRPHPQERLPVRCHRRRRLDALDRRGDDLRSPGSALRRNGSINFDVTKFRLRDRHRRDGFRLDPVT